MFHLVFTCLFRSTSVAHSSSSQQKDKWAQPGDRPSEGYPFRNQRALRKKRASSSFKELTNNSQCGMTGGSGPWKLQKEHPNRSAIVTRRSRYRDANLDQRRSWISLTVTLMICGRGRPPGWRQPNAGNNTGRGVPLGRFTGTSLSCRDIRVHG